MGSKIKVNLACGDVFVVDHDWLNFDYTSPSTNVQQANLLDRLPLDDGVADLVYSSHFLEHIPRSQVSGFLAECFRILKPDGILRLVLPDLENLCRAYLEHRSNNEHDKANFVVIEMIDQCVRQESGGELGRYYKQLKSSSNKMTQSIEFVRERTGENLLDSTTVASICTLGGGGLRNILRKACGRAERVWVRIILSCLPAAFRAQNVSLASVGERHQWLWDFEQLRAALKETGFELVLRHQANESGFEGFPFHPLDLDKEGQPRKGAESMYIEARKPR
jgi:predicted SAM-dependent methyltransferase